MSKVSLLDAAKSQLKEKEEEKQEEKGVKREAASGSNGSPTKKLASEIEKKLKSMPGDTSFVKAVV